MEDQKPSPIQTQDPGRRWEWMMRLSFYSPSLELPDSIIFSPWLLSHPWPSPHHQSSAQASTRMFTNSFSAGSHIFPLLITLAQPTYNFLRSWKSIPSRYSKKWFIGPQWLLLLWSSHWLEMAPVKGNSVQGDWYYVLSHCGQRTRWLCFAAITLLQSVYK